MKTSLVVAMVLTGLLCPNARAEAVKERSYAVGVTSALDDDYRRPTLSRGVTASVGSPVFSMSLEAGAERFRWYSAIESQPLLVHTWEGDEFRPVLVVNLGPTFGPKTFHGGPYASGGLISYGAGVRVVKSLLDGKEGARHGFEARAAYFYPETVGLSLLYNYTIPVQRRRVSRGESPTSSPRDLR
jgi:hypothetical protein